MDIRLTNDLHGTDACVRVERGSLELSRRQVRRVKRKLCGSTRCACSGPLGLRGLQRYDAETVFEFVPRQDGSGYLQMVRRLSGWSD